MNTSTDSNNNTLENGSDTNSHTLEKHNKDTPTGTECKNEKVNQEVTDRFDIMDINESCGIGNLWEISEAEEAPSSEITSQSESQQEDESKSPNSRKRKSSRAVRRYDYKTMTLAGKTSTPISNRSPSHLGPRTKKEGTSSLKNKLATLTKVKDTMAATLENTRKEMSAIKEELRYTKEELGETRKRYEGSEERNKALFGKMNKLIASQKETISDAADSIVKLEEKNKVIKKMTREIEELKNEVSDLKAPKKLHLIMDSNRELIFRSLKEKLPNYCISKCENVFTTDMLVRHMKNYKPEKNTTTVIMMGTNDIKAREYDKCIRNLQELSKQTPQNTLVMQIPPQLHEKERATLNRKLANRVITNHFEGIPLPHTLDDHKLLSTDGIHISRYGADAIAEQIVKKMTNRTIKRTIRSPQQQQNPTPSTSPPKSPSSPPKRLATTPKLWIKKEIIICNSDAGLIVGSKGAKIRQLEDDSNTRISIPTPKPGSPTKVIIEGKKQDTELATATINSILSTKSRTHTNPGETIKEIRVDEHLVGHVFGQRGDKIGRIIANTTTKINNDYHNNGDSTFIVKGKLPNVESAIRQIEKAMEDGKTAIRRANRRRESPSDRDTYHRSRRNQTDTSRQGRSRSPARRH